MDKLRYVRSLVMGLETCLADSKTTFQMEMLRNCSPEMALKKLRLRLTGHTLIRCIMAQAATQPPVPLDRIRFKVPIVG